MGTFIINEKKAWNFHIFRMSWKLSFLKKYWNLKISLSELKLYVGEKNPAYRRHRISWPLLIETPITKERKKNVWGRTDGLTDILREGGLTCHSRALKFRRKLWRYKKFNNKKCQLCHCLKTVLAPSTNFVFNLWR